VPRLGSTAYSSSFNFSNANATYGQRFVMPSNGWVTRIGAYLRPDVAQSGRLALYGADEQRLAQSAVQTWSAPGEQYHDLSPRVAAKANTQLRVGFRYDGGDFRMLYRARGAGEFDGQYDNTTLGGDMVNPFVAEGTDLDRVYPAYVDYVDNEAPLAGAWEPPTPPNNSVGSLNPTFRGTTPHPAAEAGNDYTSEVHLQVWRTSDGAMAYDNLFATTQAEKDGFYFERSPVSLTGATTYRARFRHRDQFGAYSPFSPEIEFTTIQGPNPPALSAPGGKINAIGGYNYTAVYTHPDGLGANMAEVEVWNATGTTRIYPAPGAAPQQFALVAANGDTVSVPEWHADLAWATTYTWTMRVRDTANGFSPWAAKKSFKTDSPPARPALLSPVDNKTTQERVFTASLTDPDGDLIAAAQIEIVNATTGAIVPGYPTSMTVDAARGMATYTAPASGSGSLTLGTNYRWRARADDGLGPGYGEFSGYEYFRYAGVPIVGMLSPKRTRTNLTRQPSAEYDPATLSAYWTETARSATDRIDRVIDGDAAYGVASWEGVASAAGDNRYRTPLEDVDAGSAYLAKVWLKKKGGLSSTHFAVLCYDASGTLLGTVYPSSVALANGLDAPAVWTEFGGIIWPAGSANAPAFPPGTARVRIEITPSRSSGSSATVRFDAVSLEQVPTHPVADWSLLSSWYGYRDPDTETYGEGGSAWTGTVGDSAQTLAPVLSSPAAWVAISYSATLAKKDDRLLIEKWDGALGSYFPLHDTGFPVAGSGSARTLIPVPSGYVKNEGRYRIKVQARDTTDAVGETDWVEFDARYEGAPELNILVAQADGQKGTLRIDFEPPPLTPPEYAGIEVAREATDGSEPLEIFELLLDPSATSATYHFPRPGVEYRIRARVLKVVGSEIVEGRWANVLITLPDSGYNFVKDVDNPANLALAFRHTQNALTEPDRNASFAEMLAWGAPRSTHFPGEVRQKNGETAFLLFENAQEIQRVLREIERRRRPLCLVTRLPFPEKTFVSPGKIVQGMSGRIPSVSFEWTETLYEEDYYARGGA